jgi:hypothetical protein
LGACQHEACRQQLLPKERLLLLLSHLSPQPPHIDPRSTKLYLLEASVSEAGMVPGLSSLRSVLGSQRSAR